MAFYDMELPEGIEYGSVTGVGFGTHVQQVGSHTVRVAGFAQPVHRFQPIKVLQTREQAYALKAFAIGARGSLHSWKLADIIDNTSASDGVSAPTSADQILGTGDGNRTVFQLVKGYRVGLPGEYYRTISLPVSGSIVVAVNGVTTTAFVSSGDGRIALNVAAPSGHVVTAGFRFRVPAFFEKSVDDFVRLIPSAFARWEIPDLSCREAPNEVEYPERWDAGGCKIRTVTDGTDLIAFNDGVVQRYVAVSGTVNAYFPVATYHPGGTPVFVISVAVGLAGTVQPRDDVGNTVGSALSAGQSREYALAKNGNNYNWIAL